MWVAIIRDIWLHRNRIVFKNGIVDCEEICYLVQIKGWSWAKYRNPGIHFSISDWYLSPESCLTFEIT